MYFSLSNYEIDIWMFDFGLIDSSVSTVNWSEFLCGVYYFCLE